MKTQIAKTRPSVFMLPSALLETTRTKNPRDKKTVAGKKLKMKHIALTPYLVARKRVHHMSDAIGEATSTTKPAKLQSMEEDHRKNRRVELVKIP
ncbi:MAG: hypothetical protein ACE5JI_06915 [Acidobacteriota bacterium]